MNVRILALTFANLFLAQACKKGSGLFQAQNGPMTEKQEQGRVKLVGGKTAEEDQFPSVAQISFTGICTVVKISPSYLLTAAHCFTEQPDGSHKFMPLQSVVLSPGAVLDKAISETEKIARIVLHPTWQNQLSLTPDSRIFNSGASDIALLELADGGGKLFQKMEFALVDPLPVARSQEIIIGGYGCERFAEKAEKLVPGTALKFDGRQVEQLNPAFFKAKADVNHSLCPGDSGGPVWSTNADTQKVIGINSGYEASQDQKQVSFNLFARVDGAVEKWISTIVASH